MSRSELQALVNRSSSTDRLFLSAYLRHLATRDDAATQTELTNANREIVRGKKVGLQQMKQLHRSLSTARPLQHL